ncbi:MAG: FAD-dependent oxidoreductase [Polyangiaceae bacterium]|nr:FAD-dependent oxidoreductase [Polyangiaceae bacterium]
MVNRRLTRHPILTPPERPTVPFSWNGQPIEGKEGETIAAALTAAGERVFGHHPKDGAPQGLFCANGQCAQCLVIADGKPVKACVTAIRPGMCVLPSNGLPTLPPATPFELSDHTPTVSTEVLIIGGGPAGLSAAIELDRLGTDVLLVDDKASLGGKLVLQTHRFFGSFNAVHAGTRGMDIAAQLDRQVRSCSRVTVWTNSSALAVFSDKRVGVLRAAGDTPDGEYVLVEPRGLLVATGARERFLTFSGNTLPGVLGAGAFQTLLHRDRVKPAERVLIVGGGNVGLIVAYQAIQAGIEVEAVIEALPQCGGYKVHHDKLARLGIPIYTSTTLVSANGTHQVESATVARVNEHFQVVENTHRRLACDAILLAVGMDPEDGLYKKALEFGLVAGAAGDADHVAEASAAIFAGKIKAHQLAQKLGISNVETPEHWRRTLTVLESKPGAIYPPPPIEAEDLHAVEPVLHCVQEIPCDPCSAACPQGGIRIDPDDIRHVPQFVQSTLEKPCVGCEKCVTICPGQAITLVDDRKDPSHPWVIVPFEMDRVLIREGDWVDVVNVEGLVLGKAEVVRIRSGVALDRTLAVRLRAEHSIARQIAGIRVVDPSVHATPEQWEGRPADSTIVCRCERVSALAIRTLIEKGHRDINEIKVLTRAGLGACGARSCNRLVHRIFAEENVRQNEVGEPRVRPLLLEVPLAVFAGKKEGSP